MSVDALRTLGYTVVQASDGTQALAVLAIQPRVDLLFNDIVMPGMNGRELADRAREQRSALQVLFTTGYTMYVVVTVDRDVISASPAAIDNRFFTRWLISPASSSWPSSACLRPVTSRKMPSMVLPTIPTSWPWPRAEIHRTSMSIIIRKSVSYGPSTERVAAKPARTRLRSAG